MFVFLQKIKKMQIFHSGDSNKKLMLKYTYPMLAKVKQTLVGFYFRLNQMNLNISHSLEEGGGASGKTSESSRRVR